MAVQTMTDRFYQLVEDPRVKLISQENQGACAARNTEHCSGSREYIALLDADDLWGADHTRKTSASGRTIGSDLYMMAIIDQQGRPTGRTYSNAEGEVWKQLVEKKSSALFFSNGSSLLF